jgi:hypothetical protein
MGFIRGGLLVIVSVLLFVSILTANLLFTISWSLNYDNVKVELKNVVNDLIVKEELSNPLVDDYGKMQTYCQNYSDYVASYGGSTFIIPCSVVSQGPDAVVDQGISQFIEKIYFANYDCEFFDCFNKNEIPFFIVSAKSQDYFYSKFNYVLMIIGVFSILGFILSEKKSNFFLLISILIVLAALPFAKFDLLFGLFGGTAKSLLLVFFSKSYSVFLGGIILGVSLFLLGWILKLFKVGFKISTIFAKKDQEKPKQETVSKDEIKDLVKKEVSKSKEEKKEASKKKR